jgi:PPOX class probable F420-dependent enzyme
MGIGDETYIRLTTFTRDGRPKPTPVWVAPLEGDTLCVSTGVGSWKVKRIRATPDVLVQASDMRGRPKAGSTPVEATAEVVTGAASERVNEAIARKYGWQYAMAGVWERIKGLVGRKGPESCGIVITPKG